MALCLLLCGMFTRPGGVPLGWALQAALMASGFSVRAMFFLGAVLRRAVVGLVPGPQVDVAKAQRRPGGGGRGCGTRSPA